MSKKTGNKTKRRKRMARKERQAADSINAWATGLKKMLRPPLIIIDDPIKENCDESK